MWIVSGSYIIGLIFIMEIECGQVSIKDSTQNQAINPMDSGKPQYLRHQ